MTATIYGDCTVHNTTVYSRLKSVNAFILYVLNNIYNAYENK